jgi:hypothetical protein
MKRSILFEWVNKRGYRFYVQKGVATEGTESTLNCLCTFCAFCGKNYL